MTRHFLKTTVPLTEAKDVDRRAAEEGLTRSAYMRAALLRDAERQSVAQTLTAIRAALPSCESAPAAAENVLDAVEPTLAELLQLVRLLATQANPQAAARVTAAVNHQYPQRSIK